MPVETTPAQSELGEWLESQMEAEDWPASQRAWAENQSIAAEGGLGGCTEVDVSHSYPKVLREYFARAPGSDIWVLGLSIYQRRPKPRCGKSVKRKLVD